MAWHELSDLAVRADALVCQGAVQLLRARRKAGVAGEDLAPDVECVLSAAGLELETDPEPIPPTLRRAIVQLAAHLVQRSGIPVPRGVADGEAPGGQPQLARNAVAPTDHWPMVPLCESMRLGRMG
jgi:hypothetical protein